MLTRSQARSLGKDGLAIVDPSEVGQDIKDANLLNGCVPKVKPLLPAGSSSSGYSSSSSYYTANTSFSTSSSSSLYFTPHGSFEEDKPGEYLLENGVIRHILSVENLENIERKHQIMLEETADRELEALLRERDLAYNPEEAGFDMDVDMDVDSEPEFLGNDYEVTYTQASGSMIDASGDSAEAADTVAPLAGPSKKPRPLVRTDTEENIDSQQPAAAPMDTENRRRPQPLRRQHMERWNI